jgi:hypothetical protein
MPQIFLTNLLSLGALCAGVHRAVRYEAHAEGIEKRNSAERGSTRGMSSVHPAARLEHLATAVRLWTAPPPVQVLAGAEPAISKNIRKATPTSKRRTAAQPNATSASVSYNSLSIGAVPALLGQLPAANETQGRISRPQSIPGFPAVTSPGKARVTAAAESCVTPPA